MLSYNLLLLISVVSTSIATSFIFISILLLNNIDLKNKIIYKLELEKDILLNKVETFRKKL